MEVEIPFNVWSIGKLKEGVKTATTRTTKYGEPGDTFQAIGNNYEITDVKKVKLGEVKKNWWNIEGAKNKQEFENVWIGIHPKSGWTPDKLVYIHFFRKIL
jgi:hypothetical protein